MAGPFYVDSSKTGGGNTGADWTNAYVSFWSLPTLASGEIVYVASTHVEGSVSAHKTLTCPASGAPALIYSVTSGTTTYAAGAQVKTTGGSYNLTIDGSHAAYGITFESGSATQSFSCDSNEIAVHKNCTYKGASGTAFTFTGFTEIINPTVDLTNDSSGANGPILEIRGLGVIEVHGGSIINCSNRTGSNSCVFSGTTTQQGITVVAGMDLSALPSSCELFVGSFGMTCYTLVNCKLPSTYTAVRTTISGSPCLKYEMWNCENADSTSERVAFYGVAETGTVTYEKTVVMTDTNKASADDGAGGTQDFSWKMVSTASCSRHWRLYSPWFYVPITSTGSKNLDVYFGAAETLDNEELQVQFQYLGTSGVELFTHVTSGVDANAAASTYSTTGGTWEATVTNAYYARAAVTINEVGLARARFVVGAASKTIYGNPRILVS